MLSPSDPTLAYAKFLLMIRKKENVYLCTKVMPLLWPDWFSQITGAIFDVDIDGQSVQQFSVFFLNKSLT